jgi:hypothetical protein
MAYVGNVAVFTVSLASGVTTSSGIDLGGSYGKIAVGIPSMASGGNTVFYGSDALDGTYQPIYLVQNSAPNTPVQVSIASSVSNALVNIFPITCQYLKVGVSTAATATQYTFKIYCSAN